MSIGIWQVVLVLLIVLILFGAGKLPKVMGDVAKGVKNFKCGLKDEDEEEKEAIAADVTPRTASDRRQAGRGGQELSGRRAAAREASDVRHRLVGDGSSSCWWP